MAWLAGYSKRKAITITGGASGAQTDFQIKLTVTYDGDMQSDFDDLRFTQADGQTLIDAWLETKTNDVSATVWAEFPTTPANTVEQTYYMYYGKADAVSDWDIGATFVFGDDFEDGDVSNWYASHGTPTIEAVTNPVYQGTYALHVQPTGAYEHAGFDFSQLSADHAIHFHIRAAETNLDHFFYIGTTLANTLRLIRMATDAGIDYRDGGAWNNYPSDPGYAANTWYDVEIRLQLSANKFETLWGGNSIGSDLWDSGFSGSVIDFLNIGGGPSSDTYLDNLFCRKYAANPPTYTFGSEEHQRRTPQFM